MPETKGLIRLALTEEFRVTEWNSEAEKFFGHRRGEALRADFGDLCGPRGDRKQILKEVKRLGTGDVSRRFEISHRDAARPTRWVAWTATRLAQEAGSPGGVLLAGEDMTLVREHQHRLDGIIQSAMDAIITIDADQCITLFNKAAEKMFRCSAAEAIGTPIDRFIPDRFRQAHRHHVRAFGETNVTNRGMGRLGTIFGLRANGEEFPLEASISQVEVGGGKLFTVILRDITARRVAEDTLQEERDFIAAVIDTAGALVVVIDPEGRIQRFNRACQQVTGYTFEEVRGRQVWDFLLRPQEVEPVRAVFEQLRDGKIANQYENDWVAKDGRCHRIAWTNTILQGQDGLVTSVVGTGIDISVLKQTQEQLRQTERLAELGVIASGLAHEIGTPMNVILGRAEYLIQRTEDETLQKGLATIVRQVERITKIMNQLLAYTRRRPAEPRPVDLKRLIEDSLEMVGENVAKHHVQVDASFAEGMPRVQADPDQMSQVMLNLLLNAIHAMPAGGRLRIGMQPVNGRVNLTVADTGHGIAKEHMAKIFEPFFTTKEVGKGTGLGLNVVAGIIQEHRGTIEVESEPGQGTTFTISLPAST